MTTVDAVLFDLDDTLYLQESWLAGAWEAVAAAGVAASPGINPARLRAALEAVAAEGTDKGRIIDRALSACGYDGLEIGPLVGAFRSHAPRSLPLLPGVRAALRQLREHVPIGLVTDGVPEVQRAKLSALALLDTFDVVILSDQLGRQFRKPSPEPFLAAAAALGVNADRVVFVGDRPDKDVAGAIGVGMRAIRVRTGEYSDRPDPEVKLSSVADAREAIALLLPECAAQIRR